MCGFLYIISVYCGKYCVWFDGCVHVFLTWNFLLSGRIDVVGWWSVL
jgi:hypothetical protein